jgi:DNA polymerase-3 subunit alpha
MEKEVSGVYMSAHPLDRFQGLINPHQVAPISDIVTPEGVKPTLGDKQVATIIGLVLGVRTIYTKNKQQMAFLEVEDSTGVIDVTLFPASYNAYKKIIGEDVILRIEGSVNHYNGKQGFVGNFVQAIEDPPSSGIIIKVENSWQDVKTILDKLGESNGKCPLYFEYNDLRILATKAFWVSEKTLKTLSESTLNTEIKHLKF